MILFALLFAANAAAGLAVFSAFLIGLANGTVTASNLFLWAGALSLLFSLPWATLLLRLRGRPGLATWLLVPIPIAATLAGLAAFVLAGA